MTTTYDPHHPQYLDDADVRDELTRVFDVCNECRMCLSLCGAFPTLFELIDGRNGQEGHGGLGGDGDGGGGGGGGASRLARAEQDQVVGACLQCKLCYLRCPYVPGQSEQNIDFPRLMLRAAASRHASGDVSRREAMTTELLARRDVIGKLGSRTAGVANALTARPGSLVRKVVQRTTGVSSVRLIPPFSRQRFSTWFGRRPRVRLTGRQGRVAVFPTCLVEYHSPGIGQDLVKVYERNGVECSLVDGSVCCGAPWLHSGDLDGFTKAAVRNVKALAKAVKAGNDIVVPQPTCSYVLRTDYLDHVGGPDAELVAASTFDACEYLMRLHKGEGTGLDTEFRGDVPAEITYHAPCHLRAQNIGLRSRDLLKLTGARIKVVQQCSGIDGLWGYRAGHAEQSISMAQELAAALERAGGDVVAGDCQVANTAITEQTGRIPQHPLQLIARAYGIPSEIPR